MLINRESEKTLKELSKGFPVIAVTGPRQSGKTTLVKKTFPKKQYISFDDLDKLELAKLDPKGFLLSYPAGLIIDEAQKCPEIFSYIQPIVDQNKKMGMFVLTGSQQFGLMSKITQSLAGRVGFINLLPFSISELEKKSDLIKNLFVLMFKGFYPPLYDRKILSSQWFAGYVTTYLERDLHKLLKIRDLHIFQRFLKMCATRTGQILNLSGLANDCGITHNTAKNWISVLEASYIIFLLQPYFKNYGKRLVKSPKLYFYDTGLACWLINIQDEKHLKIHPQRGALFESFVISEIVKSKFNKGLMPNIYYWRDNHGDEIDVVVDKGEGLIPIEIKSGETITSDYLKDINRWKKITGKEVKSFLVYGGKDTITNNNVQIYPWTRIKDILKD